MAGHTKTYTLDFTPTGDTVFTSADKLEDNVDSLITWLNNVKKSYAYATAPTSPAPDEGQIWYESTNNWAKVYDGTNWHILGVATGGTAPASPQEGDLWYDSTNNKLFAYTGAAWDPCQFYSQASAPSSPLEGNLWFDTTNDVPAWYDGTEWFKGGTLLDPTGDGADHGWSGESALSTAGANLVFGDLCYMKSDGKLWKAYATSTTTPCIAMAAGTIAADASGRFILRGFIRDDTWAWTIGNPLYVSASTGSLTSTAPTSSGQLQQQVAAATHADRVWFNPGMYSEKVENANVRTGTYTGDGSTGTGVTGVGFTPRMLIILPHLVDAVGDFVKMDQTWADYAYGFQSRTFTASLINSLDADGFTVDDGGADAHPNKNAQVYDYICWGW